MTLWQALISLTAIWIVWIIAEWWGRNWKEIEMTIETGGPAFPSEGGHRFVSGNEIRKTLPSSGMTIRDYFAAKAMQGWTANPLPNDSSIQDVAAWAYRQADAMIAARAK